MQQQQEHTAAPEGGIHRSRATRGASTRGNSRNHAALRRGLCTAADAATSNANLTTAVDDTARVVYRPLSTLDAGNGRHLRAASIARGLFEHSSTAAAAYTHNLTPSDQPSSRITIRATAPYLTSARFPSTPGTHATGFGGVDWTQSVSPRRRRFTRGQRLRRQYFERLQRLGAADNSEACDDSFETSWGFTK
ncbi:unnamed protein product [Lampetra planeri]